MLRNLRKKLGSKFSLTYPGYSVVRTSRFNNPFSREFVKWKQAQKKVKNCGKEIRKEAR